MLEPSLAGLMEEDLFIKILEDVQLYPKSAVPTASQSLKAVLMAHNVDSRLLGALSEACMPA